MSCTAPLAARLCATAAVLCLGLASTGCNILGPIASRLGGDQKQKAVFKLPQVPTAILVERYGASGSDVINDQMAQSIVIQFQEAKVAPTIPVSAITALRVGNPGLFSSMQIVDVGRAVGAGQVLYVDVRDVKLETAAGSEMVKSRVWVRVKVVDVATGKNLWPTDVPSYAIDEESDYVQRGQSSEEDVRAGLMEKVGFEISRLFYDHVKEFDTDMKQPQ